MSINTKFVLVIFSIIAFILGTVYYISFIGFDENVAKLKQFPVGSFVKLKYNGMKGQVRSHNYSGGFARVLCGVSPEIVVILPEEMEPIEVEGK